MRMRRAVTTLSLLTIINMENSLSISFYPEFTFTEERFHFVVLRIE